MWREKRLKTVDIAVTTVAECEICAAGHVRHTEALHEDIVYEPVGTQTGEFRIEWDLKDVLNALLAKGCGADIRQHQTERRVLRAEQRAGMRVERNDRQRMIWSGHPQSVEKVDMAAMHAVEIAECCHRIAGGGGNIAPVRVHNHATGRPN
ncbi:hypothetical protein GCM10007872_24210 [Gluconobacter sphaericus NBRC 12467]|uniref:Uncharacterized protein n=1 Tax=Gluconobacter sphaericus NBRC 12467 TaxID=1307951 RepID=A0AA37SIP4_9PROT|nr:hypothetical protein AA12467_0069 [Gluconobacter sphaericus NBRC 12467]GEB42577.1 hypothetical protein GSP01_13590 [Gluconobacter sphaericus NBRC 12467]GLQ85511.1 hypothetical protein GCM10007872_24210 [Gluconobacter sphaericus NBRC 12467]